MLDPLEIRQAAKFLGNDGASAIVDEVSEAVYNSLLQWMDEKFPDTPRAVVGIPIGKALIILGGTMIGGASQNILGQPYDCDAGLAPAMECLKAYKAMYAKGLADLMQRRRD